MDMDDDDFMGLIEFNLSVEQRKIVSRAINRATADADAFAQTNPLIAIMQWWRESAADQAKIEGSPEAILAEACRRVLIAHGDAPEAE